MISSQNEQKGEREKEQHDDGHNNILTQEIESWNNFEYALTEENRLLFNKMLSECRENEDYIRTASSKDEFYSAESLFIVLILQQQKTINELISQVSELERSSGKLMEWMDPKVP